MSKKVLVIILVIVIAIGGGVAYLAFSSTDNQPDNPESSSTRKDGESPEAREPAPIPGAGRYMEYTDNSIADTPGTKILFFHAPWCPHCRALDADIKADGVPNGVAIIKVDYDSNQALRQKYGVTLQTTLVRVDDQGNLVEKYVAYESPTLEAVKENLL